MTDQNNQPSDRDLQLLEQARAGYQKMTEQIGKAIIGQEETVRALIAAMLLSRAYACDWCTRSGEDITGAYAG